VRYSANIAANTARTAADCGPVNLPTRCIGNGLPGTVLLAFEPED
jgi:hypothetical protein